ncbi:hypothetical protein HYFRA_00011260 [Hymenoscyphus fraxineus]|uniref:Uncharacterized protein n=1 Tax=Hymenoscyphus fraxineus TaxID=746836 RepID=A0A9N9KYU6_9HELO|nr:hypothetical protein HYFRA_00011260 [Hymenoscyphus fraxineus]
MDIPKTKSGQDWRNWERFLLSLAHELLKNEGHDLSDHITMRRNISRLLLHASDSWLENSRNYTLDSINKINPPGFNFAPEKKHIYVNYVERDFKDVKEAEAFCDKAGEVMKEVMEKVGLDLRTRYPGEFGAGWKSAGMVKSGTIEKR